MPCVVCGGIALNNHDHHVVQQADGGGDGPQVELCGTDHTAIHTAARRAERGKPYADCLRHLTGDQYARAEKLALVIARTRRRDGASARPLLSVVLDEPRLLRALDLWKADRGFTNRAAAVSAILRPIADHYLPLDAETVPNQRGTRRFRVSRRGGGEDRDGLDSTPRDDREDPA